MSESTAGRLGGCARGRARRAYGFVATLQDHRHFGRILAAYGGIFVAGSLARLGDLVDGTGHDIAGATVAPVGVDIIMYAAR